MKLGVLPKNPMVAGYKIFIKAESIPRDEDDEVYLVGLRRVVGCKRKKQTGKLVSLAMVV
ncbi:hypothetical protein A2U01_0081853, partial [Trifolium medium]|nr:hypothetical protein [Trifolium medium]